MKQKILTMILLASLTVSMLTGCGQTETASTVDTQTTEITAQPEEPEQAEEVVTETPETEVASVEEPEATTEPSTEEVTPEPTEETTPEPQATYTYTDMSATMYAQQTVNVRDLPDTNGKKVGSLSTNNEIAISGQCNETGWYRFEYNGSVAYVSNEYVGENKVEVQQQTTSNSGNSSSIANNSCPYTLWQPVDEGGKIWWYVTQPDPNWETSGHKETQAWMMDTICDRGVANSGGVPEGYYGYAANEWIFMGTYAEGNVYYQSFYYATIPQYLVN